MMLKFEKVKIIPKIIIKPYKRYQYFEFTTRVIINQSTEPSAEKPPTASV